MPTKLLTTFFVTVLFNTNFVAAAEVKDILDKHATAAFVLKQPMFDYLDCEGDGTIEAGEVDEHFPQVFVFHDKDHSKIISRAEYVHSKEPKLKTKQERIFKLIDTDGDNKISQQEYRNHLIEMIEVADVNSDGEVTERELKEIQGHHNKNTRAVSTKTSVNP